MPERELKEQGTPLDALDQDVVVHIYQHADRLFPQYQQLGKHLSSFNIVHPRQVSLKYRQLFSGSRKQIDYFFDMAAVSYLVRHFNGPTVINSAEELRELAKTAAKETLDKFTGEQIKDIVQPDNDLQEPEKPEQQFEPAPPSGPGISKVKSSTRKQVEDIEDNDISGWLIDKAGNETRKKQRPA